MKVEPLLYGDRKVYTVSAFNRGVASWVARLPSIWVEGEVTEFRRQQGWQSVFFTLKDPTDGACLPVSMPRGRFDGLRLELTDGMSVHVFGRRGPILDRLIERGFRSGLEPHRPPIGPMHTLTPLLLEAFSGTEGGAVAE